MDIKAEKICKKFFRETKTANYFYAVKETDIYLPSGKITCITGRSGSGKTTLLNMLSGLLVPSEGEVLYDGTNIYKMNDKDLSMFRNKNIGVIPQGHTGLASLTVLENVILPSDMYANSNDIREYAEELLEKVGISELSSAYPNELSGGENRRLAIARSLIAKPEVVFADEPTGDLDDENTKKVLSLLRQVADSGTAVMLVTHDAEARDFSDIVYKMDGGQLRRC